MARWASSRTASEATGGKGALVVGVAFQEIAVDPVEGRPGDLGPAGVVEEDGRAVEGGELAADLGRIERHDVYSREGMGGWRDYSPSGMLEFGGGCSSAAGEILREGGAW